MPDRVAGCRGVRLTGSAVDAEAERRGKPDDLGGQSRLADAGLPFDCEHSPLTGRCRLQSVSGTSELGLAADERQQPVGLPVERFRPPGRCQPFELERRDRLLLPLDRQGARRAHLERVQPRIGQVRHQDPARAGSLHEPGSQVDRVSHRRVLPARRRADHAAVRQPRGDADPGGARPAEPLQLEGATKRTLCVVLVRDRGAEQDDVLAALVADVDLPQMAVEARDRGDDAGEVLLELGGRLWLLVGEGLERDEEDDYRAVLVHERGMPCSHPVGDRTGQVCGEGPRGTGRRRPAGRRANAARRTRQTEDARERPGSPLDQELRACRRDARMRDDLAGSGRVLGLGAQLQCVTGDHVLEPDVRQADGGRQHAGPRLCPP